MGIAALLAAALLAQAPTTDFAGEAPMVTSVELRLPAGSDAKLLERAPTLVTLRQGQRFSKRAVERTIENLYASGRFADVAVYAEPLDGGLGLIIELTPRRSITEVYVEGAKALKASEVVDASRLEVGMEYWPERVDSAAREVAERYRQRGYRGARVTPVTTPSTDGQGVMVGLEVEEGEALRLSGVSFVGEPGLPLGRLREALALAPGDVVDLGAVDRGLTRLRALFQRERFYRARVNAPVIGDDGRLVLPVVAGPRFELVFSGNRHVASTTLRRVLDFSGEEYLDGALASRLAARLARFYRFRGFHDVRVTPQEVLRPGSRDAALGFVIEEGPQVRVWAIDFAGNTAVSDGALREVLGRVMEANVPQQRFGVQALGDPVELEGRASERLEHELPSPPLDSVLVEDVWLEAAKAMSALYRQRGYLSATVALREVSLEGATAAARFEVVEGPRARYGLLAAQGLPDGFSTTALAQARPGDVFSAQSLEGVRQGLARELSRAGYLFAKVSASSTVADGGERVDAVLLVEAGPQVQVRNILPVGNRRTVDEVVLRQATMKEGAPLDVESLASTHANLMGLGIFRSVEVELLAADRPEASKTVLLKTREYARLSGEFGLGYFLADGPRVVVDLNAPNLGGRAVNLNAHLQTYFFALSTPALSGQVDVSDLAAWEQIGGRGNVSVFSRSLLPKGFGLRFDLIGERVFRQQFRFTRAAGVPTLDWQHVFGATGVDWLRPKLTLALQYELDWSRVQAMSGLVDPAQTISVLDQERLRFLFGTYSLQTARFSPTLDLRDDASNPRRGLLLQATGDVTGALSAVDEQDRPVVVRFVKVSGQVTGYVPLGRRFVLALSARAGRIFPLSEGSTTPPVKRFFLGGATSMRGFNEDQLLAEDLRGQYHQEVDDCLKLASRTGCSSAAQAIGAGRQVPSQGGEIFGLVKAELRFPVFSVVDWAVFFETGNLWLSVPARWWPLRAIVGTGMRLASPVGPLAFDVGFNLAPDPVINEPGFVFHFNIGVF